MHVTGSQRTTSLQLSETYSNGNNMVTLKAPDTLATDYTLTLPTSSGSAEQIMTLSDNAGSLKFSNSFDVLSSNYARTVVSSGTYTILSTDYIIAVTYTTTGAVVLTLPQVSSLGKKRYLIVDEGGNSEEFNITVSTNVSDTIFGAPSLIISGNYNSINIYNDGVSKWFIG